MDSLRLGIAAAMFVYAVIVSRNSTSDHSRLAAAADAAGVLAYAAMDNLAPTPPPKPSPPPGHGDSGQPSPAAVPKAIPVAAKPAVSPTGCYVTPDGRKVCPQPSRQPTTPQYHRRGILPLLR